MSKKARGRKAWKCGTRRKRRTSRVAGLCMCMTKRSWTRNQVIVFPGQQDLSRLSPLFSDFHTFTLALAMYARLRHSQIGD